jgi:hypothetical protein
MMTRKRKRTKKIKIAAQSLNRRAQGRKNKRTIGTKRRKIKRNRNIKRKQKKTVTMMSSMKTTSLRLSQKQ